MSGKIAMKKKLDVSNNPTAKIHDFYRIFYKKAILTFIVKIRIITRVPLSKLFCIKKPTQLLEWENCYEKEIIRRL